MSSIGETLRAERRKRSLDLDQISRELKIPGRFLQAIEDERFEGLPAGVFVKNFVRQYANLLGLDGEAIAAEAQRAITPEPPPGGSGGAQPEIRLPRVETWESIGGRRGWSSTLPALALVVVVMLVCSGVYAFWQRAHHEIPAQTAEATAAAGHAPAASAPAQPTPNPPAAQPGATPATPAPGQTASAQPPATPAPGQTASTQPPAAAPPAAKNAPEANSADRPAPENHAAETAPGANPPAAANPDTGASTAANPPAATGPLHLELSAQEPVWVMVRQNGKYLFSGTIEANQTRSIDASGTLLLRLGNAGGITITFNGKPVGTVGPKGQIREVQFTSGGFHILAEPKPSPAGGTPAPAPPPGDPR